MEGKILGESGAFLVVGATTHTYISFVLLFSTGKMSDREKHALLHLAIVT